MDKIGNLEIVDYRSLIVPPGKDMWIDVNLLGWKTKVNILFKPEAPEGGVRLEALGDHGRITFEKWDGTLGIATSEPVNFAVHSTGRKIYFMATLYLVGSLPKNAVGKFDIQFLMEPQE